jgi:hypothetical protein
MRELTFKHIWYSMVWIMVILTISIMVLGLIYIPRYEHENVKPNMEARDTIKEIYNQTK